MRHTIVVSIALFVATAAARAHFVFVVPDAAGGSARAVLSEDLEPDPGVDVVKITPTKLFVRRAGAADAPITWKKGDHEFTFPIPGDGPRVVYGTTVYGVMQRGSGKPFLLNYHPKAVVGDFAATRPLGDGVPAEIVPDGSAGAVRFQVLARGKPLPNAEVTVLVPGEKDAKKVKTDTAGRTPAFKPAGRYGVWSRFVEPKAGEHDGKKYEETRHYPTLVVDVGPAAADK